MRVDPITVLGFAILIVGVWHWISREPPMAPRRWTPADFAGGQIPHLVTLTCDATMQLANDYMLHRTGLDYSYQQYSFSQLFPGGLAVDDAEATSGGYMVVHRNERYPQTTLIMHTKPNRNLALLAHEILHGLREQRPELIWLTSARTLPDATSEALADLRYNPLWDYVMYGPRLRRALLARGAKLAPWWRVWG